MTVTYANLLYTSLRGRSGGPVWFGILRPCIHRQAFRPYLILNTVGTGVSQRATVFTGPFNTL